MSVSFGRELDPQLEPGGEDSAVFARAALRSVDTAARAGVVNRTHRVVRQKAKVMQARRNHVRGLMVPLIICSVLLILTAVAVWSGLYQGVEEVEADVARAAAEGDHFLAVIIWFVPVSIALLVTLWVRQSRSGADRGTR